MYFHQQIILIQYRYGMESPENFPGKGTFIRLSDVSKVRSDYHRKQLDEFSENCRQLLEKGISKEELIETINKL